jgi:hypothetical protein
VGTQGEHQPARDRVAAYPPAGLLAELVDRVAAAVDEYRAGQVEVYGVDETIHQYHRAAGELWKFCWAGGGRQHLELVASLIEDQTTRGNTPDWRARGAPRRR